MLGVPLRRDEISVFSFFTEITQRSRQYGSELARIIEQRLSPHTFDYATDLDVRARLLGIEKRRADISSQWRNA